MLIRFPYGEKWLELELEKVEVLESKEMPVVPSIEKELFNALEKPISAPVFEKLLRDSKRILLIVPDNTRAFPAKEVIPRLLERIEQANPIAEVRLLVATGLHVEVDREELRRMLGSEVVENYEIINHNASNEDQIIETDRRTSYGTPIQVNRLVMESDIVIGAGLIEPHFFAGYSGGRKILLPGVAGKDAVFNNHSLRMIGDPKARAGILSGNPIHEDMIEFMRQTRLNFIVNTTINKRKEITGVFAGDPIEAHLRGVEFLDKHVKIAMEGAADIVITTNGGYPLDRDVYQAVKGMDTAATIVRRGGVIIIAAECRDGLGGHKEFVELTRGAGSPAEIIERIRKNEPIYDQWEAQVLARVLEKARVILVSDHLPEKVARDLLLDHAKSLEEALEIAYGILGRRDARVVAIPEGPYIIPVRET
ncbi:MAG: nickel-dependent lactate racemase [Thaumarchaeota archaeon]|nr:MAG: nickel-dependent lactate racemase [Nitrososphaerota archaeon]